MACEVEKETRGADFSINPGVRLDVGPIDGDVFQVDAATDGNARASDVVVTVDPARGGSSRGNGGTQAPSGRLEYVEQTPVLLLVPNVYTSAIAASLVIAISGSAGPPTLLADLSAVLQSEGPPDSIVVIVDGRSSTGVADVAGAVLDDVRQRYNVDNDRTYLFADSTGVSAGLELALRDRQSYFAAVWFNDITSSDVAQPLDDVGSLGFAPWANVGPGGALNTAVRMVNALSQAGYRLPTIAPYRGPGSDTPGSIDQLSAAFEFFADKSRF